METAEAMLVFDKYDEMVELIQRYVLSEFTITSLEYLILF